MKGISGDYNVTLFIYLIMHNMFTPKAPPAPLHLTAKTANPQGNKPVNKL